MILHGNSLERLKEFPVNYFDSIVTDPPYGLAFMGKKWDYDVPSRELWTECLRVLKPGGHLLSFGGTRTYHRMAIAIEDAGFEIRDQLQWIFGSGFPKSHNLKDEWKGWGTALKPANEPILLARKPLEKGLTVAESVLKWGTGALNIDASRIELNGEQISNSTSQPYASATTWNVSKTPGVERPQPQGRWPANVLFGEEAAAMLDEQVGDLGKSQGGRIHSGTTGQSGIYGTDKRVTKGNPGFGDSGGPSRFFYVAKTSKRERNAGLEGMPDNIKAQSNAAQAAAKRGEQYENSLSGMNRVQSVKNHHPTVKPIKLMEYLCKLITPPAGIILDPFAGSGSTGVAAKRLGFGFVGIEMEIDYVEIARKRLETA